MSYEVLTTVWTIVIAVGVPALYLLCRLLQPQFRTRAFLCLLSVWVGIGVVGKAAYDFSVGRGGFKLGVDLVGGTTLVYEVDVERMKESGRAEELSRLTAPEMISFLKRRIDPNDLRNVSIRPVGGNLRYEIVLPTGGSHQARIREKAWLALIDKVKANPEWAAALANADLDVERDHESELVYEIKNRLDAKAWTQAVAKFREKYKDRPGVNAENAELKKAEERPGAVQAVIDAVKAANIPAEEVRKFFAENFKPADEQPIKDFIAKQYEAGGGLRKDFSAEMVEQTKLDISKQGSLEFRIAANRADDQRGIDAARKFLEDPANKDELLSRARRGLPPPPIPPTPEDPHSYTWVELGKAMRHSLGLGADATKAAIAAAAGEKRKPDEVSLAVALAMGRAEGKPLYVRTSKHVDRDDGRSGEGTTVLYSRETISDRLPAKEREQKAVDYFMLLRDPGRGPTDNSPLVTGADLRSAEVDDFEKAVRFTLTPDGGRRFAKLTTDNQATSFAGDQSWTFREMPIVLDGMIVSSAYLSKPITGGSGQIRMGDTPREERVRLVRYLRSGALPAMLKPEPVSENTIGATLGGDTIFKGTLAVGLAFAAVLVFMIIYYRFAGCVACVALLANLLLTVAFMVFVNATFTLPGLAGLVLMLGMAVDANVLIYERLREERERGAGLTLALRNGYDRALPTILDTHLTSFFTAIVLYAVGNDQLRGFGISLAAGLVISLFTSLYMTRLLFDLWQYKGWLTKLSMFKFFTRTNFDFMAIRHYWFAATVVLTLLGLGVFLYRGDKGLDIDFVGGTAYSGQLAENSALTMEQLRARLHDQKERLAVAKVEQTDNDGRTFAITYANYPGDKPTTVTYVDPVISADASKGDREREVAEHAGELPDWSVVQRVVANEGDAGGGASRFFDVSTTEKNADLVQVSVDRLLSAVKDGKLEPMLKKITLDKYTINGKNVVLQFSDFASPSYIKLFLEREFRKQGIGEQAFDLRGVGRSRESRYKTMALDVTASSFDPVKDRGKLEAVLEQAQADFASRPLPERLERVDKVLAGETTKRAGYAVLASWVVILLFLWFRFGSWTFGLAAVLCLVHDLCFTLGIISACHYLVTAAPGLASALLIEDFKINMTAIAALLTLVGYSVNDTIVVFDRIREVRGKNPQLTPQMINESINQTLSRTLLASMTVFLVVGVLYVFGGESIRLFALVMCVGVIVGTYSSIYIASPLLLIFGEGKTPQNQRKPAPVAAGTPG